MQHIISEPQKLRIRKRRSDGYQIAKQPTWERFSTLKIVAGKKVTFDFTDRINNAVQDANYFVEASSDFDGAPIEDPQLSAIIVDIPDKKQPIVIIDASKVTVASGFIYLRLTHESPSGDSYHSLWETFQITTRTDKSRP